jgi:hypothetical protein
MNERSHRRSIIGPLLLIGIGVLFLLNNLGMLSWSVWDVIFRLWPVFLIAAGLDLVIGRSSVWGSLLAIIVVVGVVALGISYAQGPSPAAAGTRESLSYPIRDAKRAEVRLSPAVGVVHLASSGSTTELLTGSTWVGGGMRVAKDFSAQGENSLLNIHAEGAGVFFPTLGPPGQPTWDLHLTPALPVDLTIDMGAGQSVVDLTGTKVYNLRVSQGVGQTVVYLPRNGVVRASLSTAIGETIVVIPPGVAARIHAGTAIVARNIPSSFVRDGDNYTSPGYAGATDKVDLELDLAIGSLSVRVGTP